MYAKVAAGVVAFAGISSTSAFSPSSVIPARMGGRPAVQPLSRALCAARPKASLSLRMQEGGADSSNIMVKELEGESEFFGVDKEGNPVKLTLAAKEKLYLDATSAFHNDGTSILSDAEYDKLKSDLAFEGSYVGLMSREEVKFMVAANRYQEGKPIMSDDEFDALRRKLKQQNSRAVVHEVPTCKVDGQTCKSDLIPDTTKNAVLYFPALIVVTIVWSELAYWFTTLQGGSPNPLTSLVVNSPFIAGFTWAITNFLLFQKPFVTSVQCPRCQTYQNIYFGDILFVSGKTEDVVETQCINKACACNLVANKQKMVCESNTQ